MLKSKSWIGHPCVVNGCEVIIYELVWIVPAIDPYSKHSVSPMTR